MILLKIILYFAFLFQLILSDVPKNPFGIGIIGNRLFWSDWGTRDIQSCDKFTGKNREIEVQKKKVFREYFFHLIFLVTQTVIYSFVDFKIDLHIYHPGLMPKTHYPCTSSPCSHLCLTTVNKLYTCACPVGMELGPDKSRCFSTHKESVLMLAMGSYLVTLHPQRFGRLKSGSGFEYDLFISRMAYNSRTGHLFVADNIQGQIYVIDHEAKQADTLLRDTKNVTALAYDYMGNNLYWTDAERNTVEIYSIQNRERAIVAHFTGTEIPIGLALLPEEGTMLIALSSDGHTHVDKLSMSGRGDHIHLIEENLGDNGEFHFHVDDELKVVFWADQAAGRIESTSFEGDFRHIYSNKEIQAPVSMTTIDENLYWTTARKNYLYYGNKYTSDKYTRKIPLAIPPRTQRPDKILLEAATPLKVINHPCISHNGGCSDICVAIGKYESTCMCQPGYVFQDAKNETCMKQTDCEFRCGSGECITMKRRCNQQKDCADNSDELGCKKRVEVNCSYDMFKCVADNTCIPKEKRCDHHNDCGDKSDEFDCGNEGNYLFSLSVFHLFSHKKLIDFQTRKRNAKNISLHVRTVVVLMVPHCAIMSMIAKTTPTRILRCVAMEQRCRRLGAAMGCFDARPVSVFRRIGCATVILIVTISRTSMHFARTFFVRLDFSSVRSPENVSQRRWFVTGRLTAVTNPTKMNATLTIAAMIVLRAHRILLFVWRKRHGVTERRSVQKVKMK